MPDLTPRPRFDPPSRWDHILAHPGTFAAAFSWIVYGVLIALPSVLPNNWEPSVTLALLPEPLALANGGTLVAAGALTAWSIQTKHRRLDKVWETQRAALLLALGGWLGHVVAVLAIVPSATVSWTMGLTHFFVAVLSLASLGRTEDTVRGEMRSQGWDA